MFLMTGSMSMTAENNLTELIHSVPNSVPVNTKVFSALPSHSQNVHFCCFVNSAFRRDQERGERLGSLVS
jgi:hypothetical protein